MTIYGTTRYGDNFGDLEEVCDGPCEGMGYFPTRENDPLYGYLWNDDNGEVDEIGYKFVTCPDCNGTGNAAP